jgi:hypothetical protein
VRDSTFTRTTRGVRIKTRANATTGPGCHGRATGIVFQNLRMSDVNTTISAIMHYPCAVSGLRRLRARVHLLACEPAMCLALISRHAGCAAGAGMLARVQLHLHAGE